MRALSILLASLATPLPVMAQTVFKCTEPSGTTVYSERPCATDPAKVQTIDTSESLKTGSGGSIAEQAEFAQLNQLRRDCDVRARELRERYAAQYRRIAKAIASIEKQSAGMDYRLAGTPRQSQLRTEIAALASERDEIKASETLELQTSRQQCELEIEAELARQATAQEERAEAKRLADKAAADQAAEKKRLEEIAAKNK